ncbi:MAG: hypothetical protein KC468_17720, partial [Myxococcales bacterium]|nr:hypothetical protein [Myxococcales bacterium]
RVPRWFTEGLSEWESEVADPSWARESAELLAAAQRKGKLRKLHELELAFLRAESPVMMEVAYSEAAYAIRYLGETYGLPQLIKILEGYAEGQSTEALFERHLGKGMPAVEREFETWLKSQLSKKVSGWHPAPEGGGPAAAKAGPRDELYRRALAQARESDFDGASRTLQQLIQQDGDGYPARMLLAEVLLQGPSWKSAKKHLERARSFHVEAIEPLVKLAEVARRAGDVTAEKAVLKDAIEIDALSLDPAARLLMLARVTGDAALLDQAYARATEIAPLHPITLAIRAERLAQGGDAAGAGAVLQRATRGLDEGPVDTVVVVALAAAAAGKQAMARELATAAQKHADSLPREARQALEKLAASSP